MSINLAIVGATGIVGKTLLTLLEERHFPVGKLFLLASDRSAGQMLTFKTHELCVLPLDAFDWQAHAIDFAFFSAGNEVSLRYAPIARQHGCVVIDNSSAFRYDDAIPLCVPEINPEVLDILQPGAIIANPNCSTIQLVMALAPLHKIAPLKRVILSTYQAVSGAGQALMDALCNPLEHAIHYNLIPQIDILQENGYSREEMKMVWETRKILNMPQLALSATAVRVPVMNAHSAAVTVEAEKKMSVAAAIQALNHMPGVVVQREHWVTPKEISGRNEVFVSRVRQDLVFGEYGLAFWIVADNLRKGAALNALQIAERVVSRDFKKNEEKKT